MSHEDNSRVRRIAFPALTIEGVDEVCQLVIEQLMRLSAINQHMLHAALSGTPQMMSATMDMLTAFISTQHGSTPAEITVDDYAGNIDGVRTVLFDVTDPEFFHAVFPIGEATQVFNYYLAGKLSLHADGSEPSFEFLPYVIAVDNQLEQDDARTAAYEALSERLNP